MAHMMFMIFFFQAEDGIRDLVRSRGLGDVYKRQALECGADLFCEKRDALSKLPSQVRFLLTRAGRTLSLIHI